MKTTLERTQVNEVLSRQELLDILEGGKLLSGAELERAAAIAPDADGKALARALVGAGMLTSYQIDAVLHRRPERLRIGNYDVLEKLGAGGMGTVFKARHRRMKRVVALKVLARNLCKDNTFLQRFQREVETLGQLKDRKSVV